MAAKSFGQDRGCFRSEDSDHESGVKLETPIVLGAKKCKERSSKRGNSERENNETSLARSVDKDIT